MALKGFGIGMLTGIGILTGVMYLGNNWPDQIKPSYIRLSQDLNNDEVKDLVITQNSGNKVPMYGIQNKNGMIYVSQERMKNLFPKSTDYKGIEAKLNKK